MLANGPGAKSGLLITGPSRKDSESAGVGCCSSWLMAELRDGVAYPNRIVLGAGSKHEYDMKESQVAQGGV